jgi:hypothetical protein
VINNFGKKNFNLFKVDIHRFPTLPYFYFAIYRINFLKDFKFPFLTGKMYNDINEAYTGSAVDVFTLWRKMLKDMMSIVSILKCLII